MTSCLRRLTLALAASVSLANLDALAAANDTADKTSMVRIPGGLFTPFFPRDPQTDGALPSKARPVTVAAFLLDERPVSRREFAVFLAQYPQWRRGQALTVFVDAGYLRDGPDAAAPQTVDKDADLPVTQVSWFAADAYCAAQGKRLPSTDEWEYALADDGRNQAALQQQILTWYERPNSRLSPVTALPTNGYGVRGLAGAIWEWTEDFNSLTSGAEPRAVGSKDRNLFCGGGSLSARDAQDYAAFMRYSTRMSLQGSYTMSSLGFRCALDVTQ